MIMTIAGVIATAIGVTGTFATGLIAFGVSAALSVGVSYLSKALQKKTDVTSASFAVQGKLAGGGDIARSFNVGYSATAGSLVYRNTWGMQHTGPIAFHTMVADLQDLPCKGLAEVWVNGSKVTLDHAAADWRGSPVVEYRSAGSDTQGDFPGDYMWVKFCDGTQTAADPFLINQVSSAARPYESTRVGVGVAYAIITCLTHPTLFNGRVPEVKFATYGTRLYDPSRDSSVGGVGGQRWSDQSTWGGDGDDLPVVQAYNILRGIYYGDEWFYGLQRTAPAQLPASNWIAQIEKCRAAIATPDGVTPTYRSGGQIHVSAPVGDAVDAIMLSCHGRLSEVGGAYKCHVGEPDSPTFFWTDDDLLSTEPQVFNPFGTLSSSINGITASHPYPADGWNTKVAEPYRRTDLEARDGNRRLLEDLKLDFVTDPYQVQRLMRSGVEEAQRERTHVIALTPRFWFVEPGDIGAWKSVRNSYGDQLDPTDTGKLFRCDAGTDRDNYDVLLHVTEVDPADYDYEPGDYTPVTSSPTSPVRPAPQGIVDWYAEPAILTDDDGLSRRPAIRIAWNGDMLGVRGVTYQLRLKATATIVASGNTDQVSVGAMLIAHGIIPKTQYQVRGQYLPSTPRDMLWSDWLDVTTFDVRLSEKEFEAGLRDLITRHLPNEIKALKFQTQEIARNAAEQDAGNELSIRHSRALLDEQGILIKESAEIAYGIDGKLTGAVFNTIDNHGYVSGTAQYNNGETADFVIVADTFYLAQPSSGLTEPTPVFTVQTVAGVTRLVLRGDMVASGSITATKLNVAALSSISANIGSITAGDINSVDRKTVLDLNNGFFSVSD